MPQPIVAKNSAANQALSKHHNRVVVPAEKYESTRNSIINDERTVAGEDEKVLQLLVDEERERVRDVTGIQSLFQLRISRSDGEAVRVRSETCHCLHCVSFDDTKECLMNYKWSLMPMALKPLKASSEIPVVPEVPQVTSTTSRSGRRVNLRNGAQIEDDTHRFRWERNVINESSG